MRIKVGSQRMSEDNNASLGEMAARIREMREIIGYSVEQMEEKT